MPKQFDITEAVAEIRETLDSYEFRPRDADPTDFQCGGDSSLRFKVGTRYGEVTVQILRSWRSASRTHSLRKDTKIEYLRITTPDHLARALNRIERVIVKHEAKS